MVTLVSENEHFGAGAMFSFKKVGVFFGFLLLSMADSLFPLCPSTDPAGGLWGHSCCSGMPFSIVPCIYDVMSMFHRPRGYKQDFTSWWNHLQAPVLFVLPHSGWNSPLI